MAKPLVARVNWPAVGICTGRFERFKVGQIILFIFLLFQHGHFELLYSMFFLSRKLQP